MKILRFIKLIYIIFFTKLPDLEYIQRSGLLAVKIGQVFALRIDFLNEEKCRHLSKLYRQTNSIPAEDINALLSAYSGPTFLDNFSKFDKKPFASASIGQVHEAFLTTGERVAVKILKKNFTQTFKKDVSAVKSLFRIVIALYPKLRGVANPVVLLSGIERMTVDELDFLNEIKGHEELNAIYRKNKERFDLGKLAFSTIYKNISNSSLMVSEYIEGKTFDQLLEERALDYRELLDLFHIHGFYMFVVGVFHGDIHPGNIIYKDGKIYFLDTGYIGRVKDRIRINLFYFFEALSAYDYGQCAYFLNRMSDVNIEGRRYEVFKEKFLELYSDFKGKSVSEVSLTKKMMETIKLGVLSGMRFEEGMFDIIKSLMYMDGMVLRCNPDAVLLEDMRKFIGEFKALVSGVPEDNGDDRVN